MVAKALVLIVGLADTLAGIALLLAPRWFFDNIGTYPPFSRHFLGDAGAFLLPIGVALLAAGRDPVRHRAIVGLGAGAGVLHTLNHAYDSISTGAGWIQTALVAVQALALIYVLIVAREPKSRAAA